MTPAPNEMPEEIWADNAQWYTKHAHMHPASYLLTRYVRSDLAPTSRWRDISVDEPPEGISVLLAYKNSMKKFVANNAHIPDWCFEVRPYCILGSGGAKSWHREATHWMPLPDAPPTKDLADAGKEGV